MCVCVNQGIYTLWGKISLCVYGDKFYIRLDSHVGNLEGNAFLPNTSFIIYEAFGNIYFSCMVFAMHSSLCCSWLYHSL